MDMPTRPRFARLGLLALFFTGGCSGHIVGPDPSTGFETEFDFGVRPDAAVEREDGGLAVGDGGLDLPDRGGTVPDSGPDRADSGSTPSDAGVVFADAGMSPPEARKPERVFMFGHSMAAYIPDAPFSIGTPLAGMFFAAGDEPFCTSQAYASAQGGPGLANVFASYPNLGLVRNAAVHEPSCGGLPFPELGGWTRIVTMPNNFEWRGNWRGIDGQAAAADDLLDRALVHSSPEAEAYLYEILPQIRPDNDSSSDWNQWRNDTGQGSVSNYAAAFNRLQDGINAARSPGEAPVRLVPVSRVTAPLFADGGPLDFVCPLEGQCPVHAFQDYAPHGEPWSFWLWSMVFYMVFERSLPPDSYVIPDLVPPRVAERYAVIRERMWTELNRPETARRAFGPF